MRALITRDVFSSKFPALVVGQRVLPKSPEAMNILLISAVIGFELGKVYDEGEVNRVLQRWVDEFGSGLGLDRVSLRRLLVDEVYLRRDRSCAAYTRVAHGHRFRFDASIADVDLHELVARARRERTDRKLAHARRSDSRIFAADERT